MAASLSLSLQEEEMLAERVKEFPALLYDKYSLSSFISSLTRRCDISRVVHVFKKYASAARLL